MKKERFKSAFALVMLVLFAHMPVSVARAAVHNAVGVVRYERGESLLSAVSVPVSGVVLCGGFDDSSGAVQQDIFFGMWDAVPGNPYQSGFCARQRRRAFCENKFLFAVMALQTFN
ncbi:MAG: hypothetical protein K2H09_08255 [Treponemataceae bacterium]|nr:hypothetical protein [Treponemataceae bacterium]